MKIGVMVLEGPYQHQAVDSAYHFIKAALAKGHEIVGVFENDPAFEEISSLGESIREQERREAQS